MTAIVLRRAFLQFCDSRVPILDVRDIKLSWCGLATLQGPSGSGKTALFRLMSGWYEGDDPKKALRFEPELDPFLDFRLVGGHASLLPWRTVEANMQLQLRDGFNKSELAQALAKVGLRKAVLDRYVYELSLGMYKRVELVIAVLQTPRILLLDEFFSSLDRKSKSQVGEFLKEDRGEAQTLASVHEEELRDWIGGPRLEFVQCSETSAVIGINRT